MIIDGWLCIRFGLKKKDKKKKWKWFIVNLWYLFVNIM